MDHRDRGQHEVLLQAILEHSPIGIAIVSGPERVYRMANPTYCDILPEPLPTLTGQPYRAVWAHDSAAGQETLLHRVIETSQSASIDHLELRFPDNTVHCFALHFHPFFWSGEPGAIIFLEETTEAEATRKLALSLAQKAGRSDDRRKDSRAEELEAIITAMAEAVVLFNAHGLPEQANPAAMELFGIDPEGIDASELVDLLGVRYPDGSPMPTEELPSERALKGETVVGQRLLLVDADGQERMVRVSASPVFKDQEKTVYSVVTVWYDVTERERLLEQVEIEQSRLFTIIENAPEGIVVADEEGRIVMSNPAAEALIGRKLPYGEEFTSHARLGICYSDGTPYDPRNLPLTCSALDGERLNNVEMLVRLPGGKTRTLLSSFAPIVDRRGNLNGAVGVFQDITIRKLAYEREARRARELQALNRATTALLSTIDLESLLAQIMDAAHSAIPAAEKGVLYLLSSTSNRLEIRATFGLHTGSPADEIPVPVNEAIQNRRTLLIRETPENALEPPSIIAPLILPPRVLGALVLTGSMHSPFTDDDLRLLDSFAATATAALQNASLYEEVQRLATLDTLTEQYNRRKFFELGELEIHRFRRFNNPLSAIMLDLDNFKEINDTYGHAVGDLVLHTVAVRARSNVRVVDILGRYGGDEFAILLPDAELEEANEIAERIRQAVTSEPIPTELGPVHISTSLGVAQATPDIDDLSTLLIRADAALLLAKQSGRNQVHLG